MQPFYSSGIARSAAESQFPQFWRGLHSAWIPTFRPTGNKLFDYGPRSNHGVYTGTVPATDWIISDNEKVPGYEFDYDGVDAVATISNFFPPRAGSLVQWAKKTLLNRERPFGSQDDFEVKWDGSSKFTNDLMASGATVLVSTGTYTPGVWHFVVFTYNLDNTTQQIYIDGVFDSEDTATANDEVTGPVTLGIGQRITSGEYWEGSIGPTLLYNRVLSANEIKFLYHNTLCMFRQRRVVANSPVAVPAVEGGAMFFGANF